MNHLKTPTEIYREVNLPQSTVSGIIQRFETTGDISYKPLGGDLRTILKDHHKKFILNTVDKNNTITLLELQKEVADYFDDITNISITTLCKFLKDYTRNQNQWKRKEMIRKPFLKENNLFYAMQKLSKVVLPISDNTYLTVNYELTNLTHCTKL
jgi:transposase